jgi:isopentenyl diphosphate isomerase/L-lactate dehydrogenase-like FMN-dependent dehydrogenase
VLVDGGIRRGTDVVKALALGAKAVLVGRPWLHALAAGGTPAVVDLLAMLTNELDRTLALVGCADVRELSPELVRLPMTSDPGSRR